MNNMTITIRPIPCTDAQALAEILRDDSIKKTYMVPDLTADTALQMANRISSLSGDEKRYIRGIYVGEILVGFLNDVATEDGAIELGWVVAPAHQNKGYATQAVTIAISELFARGFKEVQAGAFPQNVASMRVMEKAGMERIEKTEQIEYRGNTYNCIFYARRNHD